MGTALQKLNDDAQMFGQLIKVGQAAVHEVNVSHGWFDLERTFGDGIALIHSEASEALEEFRKGGLDDLTLFPDDPTCKPEGVGSEYADILVRLLDECERNGIDLGYEFVRKVNFNNTRPYRHGNKAL